MKLSSILCDNSDDIENIQVAFSSPLCRAFIHAHLQVYAMVLPDHEINPRVPCKSGVLPRIDLNR